MFAPITPKRPTTRRFSLRRVAPSFRPGQRCCFMQAARVLQSPGDRMAFTHAFGTKQSDGVEDFYTSACPTREPGARPTAYQ
jgi:hypothetical protein